MTMQNLDAVCFLDNKYFKPTKYERTEETLYVTFEPIYRTIFLVSTFDNQPLASISLKLSNPEGRLLIESYAEKSDNFHAITNKNNYQIEFVISNLQSDGMIKMDITKNNVAINCVDPGSELDCLNKVNEINEYNSHCVELEQKTNSKIIFNDSDTYYISVTPEVDATELIKKFQSVKWVELSTFSIAITNKCQVEMVWLIEQWRQSDADDSYLDEAGKESLGRRIMNLDQLENCLTDSEHRIKERNKQIDKQKDSFFTNINYEYNVPSNQTGKLCALSLSVNEICV